MTVGTLPLSSICRHKWNIETEDGRLELGGICKYCGVERKFLSAKGLNRLLGEDENQVIFFDIVLKSGKNKVPKRLNYAGMSSFNEIRDNN